MVISRYAGVGQICPTWNVQVSSGGNFSSSRTLYFGFQLQNRAGFNIPSVSGAIAHTQNQQITFSLPEMPPGWDIHYFVLSAGTTPDPSTFVQIARMPGYQCGPGISPQSLKTALPTTIALSRDAHIALAPTVATLNDLPIGLDRLDGQARWVTSEAKWFEYRADSNLPMNIDTVAADFGQWVRIGSASTYVSDTTTGVGSDRPIISINPITTIPTPPYPGQPASNAKVLPNWEAQYWLYNDDNVVLPAGTEFGIELEYNNQRSPDLLNGLFLVRFLGYVGFDGSIRTSDSSGREFLTSGAYYEWQPKVTTPFVTPDDLQPGEAIALGVKPYFSAAELNNQMTPKSVIGVIPVIRTQSGDYNPLGKLIPEGVVYAEADRYRVVPNTGLSYDILSGNALIGSYDFPVKPRRTFGGLSPNTALQQVVINGNAAVFTEPPTYTPSASEALRALVGTIAGTSIAGQWSNAVAISTGATLTLAYPSAIRGDYPDAIALSNKAKFNPPFVTIFLQRLDTKEIRQFSGYAVTVRQSQKFTLSDWSKGSVVSGLPSASTDFSLFAALGVAIAPTNSGNFPSANYRATYAFVYDGNQITTISHASPPCITEFSGNFAAIFDSNVYVESQEDSFVNALIFGS